MDTANQGHGRAMSLVMSLVMSRGMSPVIVCGLFLALVASACQPVVDTRLTSTSEGTLVELPLESTDQQETPLNAPANAPADAPMASVPEGVPLETTALSEVQEQLVSRAMEQMATELGVSADDVVLTSIESLDWPDASLGCPEPDMVYAQMLTSGYRMVLAANDTVYTVHTSNRPNSMLATCESAE